MFNSTMSIKHAFTYDIKNQVLASRKNMISSAISTLLASELG